MMNCRHCQQSITGDSRWCPHCGTFVPESLIGRVLGDKYEILGVLGMGGMGAVYRARRKHIGDEVVIKTLLPHLFSEMGRFRREVEAAAMVKHSNVVKIYDYDEARGELPAFIAMEMVRGELLSDLLQHAGRLEASRAVALMIEICRGVGAAHQKNIPHRDLKPANVMVVPPQDEYDRESVKVLDFGLAKLGDPNITKLTLFGQLLGTPFYMSPEQWRGDEKVDVRSDVYSLGVMLYEMLAGALPFTANDIHGISQKHQHEDPPPLPQAFAIPPALEAVMMHALAKDPSARPQDAIALARDLQAAMGPQRSQPTPPLPTLTEITDATPPPAPTQPSPPAYVPAAEGQDSTPKSKSSRSSNLVSTTDPNPLSKPARKPDVSESAQRRHRKLWVGLVVATVVLTGLVVASVLSVMSSRNQLVSNQTEPLTVKQSPTVSTPAPSPSTSSNPTTPTVRSLGELTTPRVLYKVAMSPDGQVVASTGDEKAVRLWRVDDQSLFRELKGAMQPGRSVAVSPDGQTVASGSDDGAIRLWQMSDSHLLYTIQGHTQYVFIVGFSPDGQTLVSASGDKKIKLWRVSDGKLLGTVPVPKPEMLIINISPDQRTVALYGPKEKEVQLWSLNEDRPLRALEGSYDVSCGAFSSDGEVLALGSKDGMVRLWHVSDGRLVMRLEGTKKDVSSVTFSPNGEIVVAGRSDGTIDLWHVRDRNLLKTLEAHKKRVQNLTFNADGRVLASGDDDKTIRLWWVESL